MFSFISFFFLLLSISAEACVTGFILLLNPKFDSVLVVQGTNLFLFLVLGAFKMYFRDKGLIT